MAYGSYQGAAGPMQMWMKMANPAAYSSPMMNGMVSYMNPRVPGSGRREVPRPNGGWTPLPLPKYTPVPLPPTPGPIYNNPKAPVPEPPPRPDPTVNPFQSMGGGMQQLDFMQNPFLRMMLFGF